MLIVGLTIFALIFICIYLTAFPRVGIWLIIFFSVCQLSYFSRWTSVIHFPKQLTWFPFFISGVLLLPLIARQSLLRRPIFYRNAPLKILFWFTMLILFTASISSLLNEISPLTGLFGMRYILLLPIIVFLIYLFESPKTDIESYIKFIVFIGLIQIPLTIIQRILFGALNVVLTSDTRDLISGSFSNDGVLTFTQLFSFSLAVSHWARTGKVVWCRNMLLLSMLLLCPIFISNSRASIVFLFFIIGSIVIRYKGLLLKGKFGKYIFLLLFVAAIGTAMIFGKLQKFDYGRDLKTQYSLQHMKDYLFAANRQIYEYKEWGGDPRMGRGMSIITAYELIKQRIPTLFFGLGPGSTQKSLVFGKNGKYYEEYGYLSGLGRTQISLILAELGFMGIFLFVIFFYSLKKIVSNGIPENTAVHLLTKDVLFFFTINILLNSIYSQLFFDYAIILFLGYFIAVIQRRNLPRDLL